MSDVIVMPAFAPYWTADEVAECLPGMLSSGAYDILWSFVSDDESPALEDIWDKLGQEIQEAIIQGYASQYPGESE